MNIDDGQEKCMPPVLEIK